MADQDHMASRDLEQAVSGVREPAEAGRPKDRLPTHDWRDCSHCAHYTSAGNAGGTPPWSVCQFWPRRNPQDCGSYTYKHRPSVGENGEWVDYRANSPEPDA